MSVLYEVCVGGASRMVECRKHSLILSQFSRLSYGLHLHETLSS